jgi:hypothetical protein
VGAGSLFRFLNSQTTQPSKYIEVRLKLFSIADMASNAEKDMHVLIIGAGTMSYKT